MNAQDVLEAMQAGATVRERWLLHGIGTKGKRPVVIHYPDGTKVTIQESQMEALMRRGYVKCIVWVGGNYDYELTAKGRNA